MSGEEKSLCYYVYARFTYAPESKIFLAAFDYTSQVAGFVEEFLDFLQTHGVIDSICEIIVEPAEVEEVKE